MKDSKIHWDRIYSTKTSKELSWTQSLPQTSLDFLHNLNIPKNSPIIDVGGGESVFVDCLLREGYTDITVLDISEKALANSRERLGPLDASRVQWIVSDITAFAPTRKYHFWHDRATFHFLTSESQIAGYISLASRAIDPQGFMMIGTFSENGPAKCSGLPVVQYSEDFLSSTLATNFMKIRCITEDHETPFHTFQNFLFCSFRKIV
jgi:ubiquinone/menaquinone biosynthesis C-methylase UbiE